MFTGREMRLAEAADLLGLRLVRDCGFAYAGKLPTKLTPRVVPCSAPEHLAKLSGVEGVAGVLTREDLASSAPEPLGLALSDDPMRDIFVLQSILAQRPNFQWEGFPSRVHPSARIAGSAVIANSDVEIGAHTVIHPGAMILERSIIGAHVSIGPGSVVGCNAFEVNRRVSPPAMVSQTGGVMIGDHVDILAKSTISRATFGGFTRIGLGSKIDSQVHVGHDCEIGAEVRIAACAELSGRVIIGDGCEIGPSAMIGAGVIVGARAQVTIGAVIGRDVAADERVSGLTYRLLTPRPSGPAGFSE